MRAKQVESMVLDPNEKKQLEIWHTKNDMQSLIWYVQQLVHYAYRVGLEQNAEKARKKVSEETGLNICEICNKPISTGTGFAHSDCFARKGS